MFTLMWATCSKTARTKGTMPGRAGPTSSPSPEVTNLLKVADKVVYGLAQNDDLPDFKVGGQWRFRRCGHRLLDRGENGATGAQTFGNGAKPSNADEEG